MAEPVGITLGVVGLAFAFKGAVDTVVFVESLAKAHDCGDVIIDYHFQKIRLQQWGDMCRINTKNCTLISKTAEVRGAFLRIFNRIQDLDMDAAHLMNKYSIRLPDLPSSETNQALSLALRGLPEGHSTVKVTPALRLPWAIRGRGSFEGTMDKISGYIDKLYSLTHFLPTELQLITDTFSSYVLTAGDTPNLLDSLDKVAKKSPILAHAVQVKAIRDRVESLGPSDSIMPTQLQSGQLTLMPDSPRIGKCKLKGAREIDVWVEWKSIANGPSSNVDQYVKKIELLGGILEKVSVPSLRLPRFCGVYNDAEYEMKRGFKRIGYVFSTPPTPITPNNDHPGYETDLENHPPKSLRSLIKECTAANIPLLEDRFRLAYILACAFSDFHSLGWLYKGLHTGSVIFLENAKGKGITITEPFITEFEYSRPTDQVSLSRGTMEENLIRYYHPDSVGGFTRGHDLYGLGVILWEIGRWQLLDCLNVTKDLKKRQEWNAFMTKHSVQDMGWRMGSKYQAAVKTLLNLDFPETGRDEYGVAEFTRHLTEKVIRPLGELVQY